MSQVKKFHINPQSILGFWCDKNGKLKAENKNSTTLLQNIAPENVCFRKRYLTQELEKEFAKGPDNEIKNIIVEITKNKIISNDNKIFLARFLTYQSLRDPEIHEGVLEYQKKVFNTDNVEMLIYFICTSFKPIFKDRLKDLLSQQWKLLDFGNNCLITTELLTSRSIIDKLYKKIIMFFPITPRYCIVISKENINYIADNILANYINEFIRLLKYNNWIILPP